MEVGMFQSQRVFFVFLTLYALCPQQFCDNLPALFSFSEQHLIFVAADVLEPSFQKFSGVFNIIGDGGAIFVIVFKLY
jgi:hypothetical protein